MRFLIFRFTFLFSGLIGIGIIHGDLDAQETEASTTHELTSDCVLYEFRWKVGDVGEFIFAETDSRFVYRYWSWLPEYVEQKRISPTGEVSFELVRVFRKPLQIVYGFDGSNYWLVAYPDPFTFPNVENVDGHSWVLPSSKPVLFKCSDAGILEDRMVVAKCARLMRENKLEDIAILHLIQCFAGANSFHQDQMAGLGAVSGVARPMKTLSRNKFSFGKETEFPIAGPWTSMALEIVDHKSHSIKTVEFRTELGRFGTWWYFFPNMIDVRRLESRSILDRQFELEYYLNSKGSAQDVVTLEHVAEEDK